MNTKLKYRKLKKVPDVTTPGMFFVMDGSNRLTESVTNREADEIMARLKSITYFRD